MNVGRLRHRVMLQQRQAASNDPAEDFWADTTEVWAFVQPSRGAEQQSQQQSESAADHKVTMRPISINARENRLVYQSRIFDIESVINIDERDKVLEVLCKERI